MVPRFALPGEARLNRWCTTQRAGLDGRTGELPCGGTSINRLDLHLLDNVDRWESTVVLLLQATGRSVGLLEQQSDGIMTTHSDDRTSGGAGGRDLRLDRMRKPDVRRRCVSITGEQQKNPATTKRRLRERNSHAYCVTPGRDIVSQSSSKSKLPSSERFGQSIGQKVTSSSAIGFSEIGIHGGPHGI